MTDEIIIADSENVKNALNGFQNALKNVKEISPLTFSYLSLKTLYT